MAGRRASTRRRAGRPPPAPGGASPSRRAGERTVRPARGEPTGAELVPAGPPTGRDTLGLSPPLRPLPPPVERGPAPPAGYAEDRVVAMVRDPRCLFVYWELGGRGYRDAERQHGAAAVAAGKWKLRIEHLRPDRTGLRYFDVPVTPEAGNWYLPVEPAALYRVRLGMVLPSGLFVDLAVSWAVTTPPESASAPTDGRWLMTCEEFEQLVAGTLGRGLAGSSPMARLRARMALSSWKG